MQGYHHRGAYIAAQGPLAETVGDFWRMVMQYDSCCQVLLCETVENEQEMCHCYWPCVKDEVQTHGKLEVQLLDEHDQGDYIQRKMELRKGSSNLFLTQFQLFKWSESQSLQDSHPLLEVCQLVARIQMTTGNKPITVICK